MKPINPKLLFLFGLFALSSCVINPTDYNMFKKNFVPFSLETTFDSTQMIIYREIKAEELTAVIKKNITTILFLNNISCGGSIQGTRMKISAYEQIVKEVGNVAPVYVFSGFSVPNIQTVLDSSNIVENMYFIHHAYGSNIGIMEHNFFKELGIELKSDKFRREPLDWAVFQDGVLIQKCHSDFEGVELKQFLRTLMVR
ncbi:MAG: hypothetical protein PHU27_02630 [Salinivirgaceae bacterium]|nr:hypothetical protein [Salinivirgaceae bacterium]MDD4747643.1 hypothetical protein [Salinivirgaceae bacterium]